jgi:hypothetical protein
MTLIKLKLRKTSEGFFANLTAKSLDVEGYLPPLPPELESSFDIWQSAYRQIDAVRSCIAPEPGLRLTPKSATIYSTGEHTLAVKDQLNKWLNSGDSRWQPIRDSLIAIAHQFEKSGEEIRVVIDAKDINLRRFPWQEWDLFEKYYNQAEIALSVPIECRHDHIYCRLSPIRNRKRNLLSQQ